MRRNDFKKPLFPVIKISISIIICLLIINRGKLYDFLNIQLEGILKFFETIIFLVIGVILIWIIYMEAVEIYYIYENSVEIKEKEKGELLQGELYLLEEIVLLLDKNDIIEIKIKAGKQVINIGSSSDSKAGSNKFFDKRFYIENIEYGNLETFRKHITPYVREQYLEVVSIDGIKQSANK